jgi:16S rRNA G1207 methylase RsmC
MIQNVHNTHHFRFAWKALHMMHEETSTCPHIGHCRDAQTLRRAETQLIRERRNSYSQPTTDDQGDNRTTIEEYRKRIQSIGKAMERCRKSYRRCLRYWQLQKKEETEANVQQLTEGETITIHRS